MSAPAAPRSACTPSAPRRRSRTCCTKFGFTPDEGPGRREGADRHGQRERQCMNVQHDEHRTDVTSIRSSALHDHGQAVGSISSPADLHRRGRPQEADRAGRAHRRHLESRRSSKRPSAAATITTPRCRQPRARAIATSWRSTSGSRSRTSSTPPTRCARSTRQPTRATAMSASKSRPIWRWTPRRPSRRRGGSGNAVGRDNLMIKVPATKAGLPAIRQLIGEGINVNITLLFSQQVYEAGGRGLSRRARASDRARRRCRAGSPASPASSSAASTWRSTS